MTESDTFKRLTDAVQLQNAGRREEAIKLYRQVLAVQPAQADAVHLCGVTERQLGRPFDATRWIARARRLAPHLNGVDVNFDNAVVDALNAVSDLVQTGEMGEAFERMRHVARAAGERPDVMNYLATVRLISGDEQGARRINADINVINAADRKDEVSPALTALGMSIDAIDRHRADYGFAGTVVIPAFRAADYIAAALDSVEAAVAYYRRAEDDPSFKVHVAVVDDCSPDGTVDVVRRWAQTHPRQSVGLLMNNQNRGAGRSRNAGAETAFGRFLWYLDADDYFLPEHLHVTARQLDRRPELGYVRTGILFDRIDDRITTDWRRASEHTYPCNLCVRRECHQLVEGFPEEYPFGPAGPEDVAYSRALQSLFVGGKTETKTVFYTMRPGNILDKLHQHMLEPDKPPGVGMMPEIQHTAVEILIRRRLHRLNDKRNIAWNGPPLTPDRRTRLITF
jgi:tetratricopeptide (TPR) repeat protein